MLLVLDALDVQVLILWVLLSVSIVHYSLHSSLHSAFQQIFFLLASCSWFYVLFVLPSASDGLVQPCRRWDLCYWRLLDPRPLARVGAGTHHVFLASGVPYRWTCSSLGVIGLQLAFLILPIDSF